MKIGEAMYKAQQADRRRRRRRGRPVPRARAGAKPDDKVVDAEFEEVDEKKKRSGLIAGAGRHETVAPALPSKAGAHSLF